MSKEIQKYNDITPDMNLEWEAKYGKDRIVDLEVETASGKNAKFVLRKPNRTVMEAIGEPASKGNVAKVNQIFIANCVLGGDMEALENDGDVYAEVLSQIVELTSKAKSKVKKR